MTELKDMRVDTTVSGDQAVAAEIKVVVCFTEVSAVSDDAFPVDIFAFQSLIDPVPDETALQTGECIKKIPVMAECAAAVAHGMRIFAQYARPVGVGIIAVSLKHVKSGIHGVEVIVQLLLAAFEQISRLIPELFEFSLVMDRPGIVQSQHGMDLGGVIFAVA